MLTSQRLWPQEQAKGLPLRAGNGAPVLGADPAKKHLGKGRGVITDFLLELDRAQARWCSSTWEAGGELAAGLAAAPCSSYFGI